MLILPNTVDPEADVVNTFWFNLTDEAIPGVYDDIVDQMRIFYQDIRSVMSEFAAYSELRIKLYDMTDPEPRAPVVDQLVVPTLGPSASTGMLPPEVALCVSFAAEPQSGVPQARRRGRVYIGPLKASANSAGRPNTGIATTLATSAGTLLAASDSSADWSWVVYSRTNDSFATVASGWVDNEFDIQRRRHMSVSDRATFS